MTTKGEEAVLPTLYRGDSLPKRVVGAGTKHRGRTFAEYYFTEGLLAKSADGGRSCDLNRPLAQLVAVHVGYRLTNERETYAAYHSPLISFSLDAMAAWHFLDRTDQKSFAHCDLEEATHFMWKLADVRARAISPGRYRFEYRASTKNVNRFREDLAGAVRGGDLDKLPRALAAQIVHSHVQVDSQTHVAELVDVTTFLEAIDAAEHDIEAELLDQARKRGRKWAEWLVYPMDVVEGLAGFSSRFTLNDNLDFHLFAREDKP